MIILKPHLSLSKAQHSILNKGLTFVPTININKNQRLQLEYDLENCHCKIKLAAHFASAPPKKVLTFSEPSNWTLPLDTLPSTITELIKKDQRILKRQFQYSDTPRKTEHHPQ